MNPNNAFLFYLLSNAFVKKEKLDSNVVPSKLQHRTIRQKTKEIAIT